MKEGYKQTEIGEIPEEWEVAKLGDLCNIQVGKTPSRKIKEYWDKEKTTRNRWVSIADMLGNKIINDTNEYISDKAIADTRIKRVSAGTLLMSFKLTVGRMAFAGVDLFTNEAIAALAPRDSNSISTNYLYYAIEQARPESYCDPAVKGKTLNQPKIKSILLSFPPLPEQKKIASVLSTVDAAIEKTSEIIEQAKQVKKSLMQELLTRGIGHKKFKQTDLGEVPEEWEVVNLWDLADYINGMPFKPSDWKDEGTPIIRIQNLTGLQEEYNYYQGEADPKYYVYAGDILLSWSATLDAFEWKGEKAVLNQHIFNIKPHEGFDKKFLFHLLKFHIGRLRSKTHGTGMTHITKRNMKTISIPTSRDLAEQKKIAEILGAADAKIEAEVQKRTQLETLKKGLMQDLLTGRVRFPEFVKGVNS